MRRFIPFLVAILGLSIASPTKAELISFGAVLSGPAESPPNASPGTGIALVDIDAVAHTMRIRVTFSGLLAPVTASHIHGPTAVPGEGLASVATAVPTFPGFPSGVTSGTYDQTFNTLAAGSYNPAFLNNATNGGDPATAELSLFNAIAQGRAYLNVHTTQFPGGEIRGFLTPVPAPPSAILAGVGAVVMGAMRLIRVRPSVLAAA